MIKRWNKSSEKMGAISKSNRLSSLDFAEQKNFEIAILDDGLQQNINYNLKIACFNTGEGIGNGYLLPAGPLEKVYMN